MKPPIWFLDIDGVINSIGAPLPDCGVDVATYRRVDVTTSDDISWPICFSSVVVDFINEMHRYGFAEVRWLTTWQDARLRFAPAVGLDDFFAYNEPNNGSIVVQSWWKEVVVRNALAETSQVFIWTDDDLEDPVRESIHHDFHRRSLMIRPSLNPGLNDEQLNDIRRFFEAVTTPCVSDSLRGC